MSACFSSEELVSGKRYKTKKERMRIERDGPPLLQDGSLDYTESRALICV